VSNEPRRLGDAVARVARDFGLADPRAFQTVTTRWPAIVGPAVAAHATPRHLRDGVLVVDVDDGAWATQLRYLEADIIRDLDEAGVAVSRVAVKDSRGR